MKRRDESTHTSWLAVAAGTLGGLVIWAHAVQRRLYSPRPMPHIDIWQRALAGRRGEIEAALLAGRMQARYCELYAQRPRFARAILRLHLDKVILPGLTLYRTLLEEDGDEDSVLAEVAVLFEATFGRFSGVVSLLNILPESFGLFRRITRRTIQLGFPSPAWQIEPVEDSEHCIAFDYHRCFYLDLLRAYGAPELAPLYCRTDDMLYESLPAEIIWHRSGTLAHGSDCCDFRWCRRDQPILDS